MSISHSIMIKRDIAKLKTISSRLVVLGERLEDIYDERLISLYHDELDDISCRLCEIGSEINRQINEHNNKYDNNTKDGDNTTVKDPL